MDIGKAWYKGKMRERKACKNRLADLEAEQSRLELQNQPKLVRFNRDEVDQAVRDIKGTLKYASHEDLKELLRENIKDIRIPETGTAQLEANPTGLLLRCKLLVTPRGVA